MKNAVDIGTTAKVILVTGGTGFLGSHLVRNVILRSTVQLVILVRNESKLRHVSDLIEQYKERISIINIDTIESLSWVFLNYPIDAIIHCATHYGRKSINPLSQIRVNLVLPLELLELGRIHGIRYFINTDTILDKRISHYSLSKKQFKDWMECYCNDFVCINMALEHFYGAHDDVTKFISYIIDSMLTKVPIINLTSGVQKRDFIYIEDVVEAFMTIFGAMSRWQPGFYCFEIGTSYAISIKDMVLLIKRLSKNEVTVLNFGGIPLRENEVMESYSDASGIRNLGWEPIFSIEQGLLRTINMEKSIRGLI